jgi:hypothetical protein
MGVKGACPLMLPPPLGGRGSPSQFPRQLKKLEGISHENKHDALATGTQNGNTKGISILNELFSYDTRFF